MDLRSLLASKRFREFAGVGLFGLGVILGLSALTFDADDPSYFTHNEALTSPHNFFGRFGATLAMGLFQALGLAAYLLPVGIAALGTIWFLHREWRPIGWRALGYAAAFGGLSLLFHLGLGTVHLGGGAIPAGGILGSGLAALLVPHLNLGGAGVLAVLAILLGILGATRLSLRGVALSTAAGGRRWVGAASAAVSRHLEARRKERQRREVLRKHARQRAAREAREKAAAPSSRPAGPAPPADEPAPEAVQPRLEFEAAPSRKRTAARATSGLLPPLDLLDPPEERAPVDRRDLEEKAQVIVERSAEFGVAGEVVEVHPGPVVTTFEFRPEPGVKYSRVIALVDDLCLALRAESIRIDRIPGKSTVGIEVPNRQRETISLRELLASREFQESTSKLRMALGKGIHGAPLVGDLAEMPHLLVAGSTGSGKSVTLNALITSILYSSNPEDVKFIMVDTKRLELGVYEDIPHLITPVVTEAKKASNALRWAVREMERRYKLLAGVSVRSIGQFNKTVRRGKTPKTDADGNPLEPIPYIVVIIDELADLMLTAAREVEESIMRLAQMARAVGVHLILSTQRPSVDVITGVIKANLPSRMALRVTSKVDSRTIIDGNGAEKLLGMGDMLFIPPRSSRLVRVHGPYISEVESVRLAQHLREAARPDYDESVTADEREEAGPGSVDGERDVMYDQAVRVVIESGLASTSQLQRRLRLGFARAGRLMDMLEADGIVGPQEGAKPRQVLVNADYLAEFQAERRD
jgi:S-DNA-T family DNA segregation ATPase FtsK/SpoIIIE